MTPELLSNPEVSKKTCAPGETHFPAALHYAHAPFPPGDFQCAARRTPPFHRWMLDVGRWMFLTILLVGCSKSTEPASPASNSALQTPDAGPQAVDQVLVKLHWLGKQKLLAEASATNVVAIWNLPETVRLEGQTLDKLTTAPWRLLKTPTPVSNAPVAALRPLLDDLVQAESFLEVRGAANQPAVLVFAIRLAPERAALWQTNLPAIFTSLATDAAPGASSSAAGPPPTFNLQLSTFNMQLTRSGDWTLLALNFATALRPPSSDFQLLSDFKSRIQSAGTPFAPRATNHWLEVEADLQALHNRAPQVATLRTTRAALKNLPHLRLAMVGHDQQVRTSGELVFPQPLNLQPEPWRIPTNYICDPLVSFTAVRGTARWFDAWPWWRPQSYGPPPNQVFFWAQSPALWQHFVTYPVANATNHVRAVGDWVVREWNPLFQTNRVGKFDWNTNKFGLLWMGLPYFKPVIEPAQFAGADYALIGFFANNATNRSAPAALFTEFVARTNLVYYDWELTGPQVQSWTQMSQLLRLIFGKAQMPSKMASLPWLRAITPKLGNAATVLTLETPTKISLQRSSTMGLTGPELHLFADWLESPRFPLGLHTWTATRPTPPPPASTNAPAAPAPGR